MDNATSYNSLEEFLHLQTINVTASVLGLGRGIGVSQDSWELFSATAIFRPARLSSTLFAERLSPGTSLNIPQSAYVSFTL